MLWISSTEKEKWNSENELTKLNGSPLVIGEKCGKPIWGWGCCISELGVKAIFSLPEEKQKEVFDELFGVSAANFTYCRLPVGANDFAESWYSYNETAGDYEMKNFSIERDRRYIIPAIREAQKRSAQMQFFASPWSPPTWMKCPGVYNFGRLIQSEENLKAYALYFRKYLEAYEKEGIKISQIYPQNEIFADQKFPSCLYTEEELENFIANYLIDEIGDMAEIWFGTLNGSGSESYYNSHNCYLNKIMQNPKCRKSIKGAGFQWAGKFAVLQAAEDYPELNIVHTECQCSGGENTWEDAMFLYEHIHHYFRHGARANVYWNMALNEEGFSTWGWRQNALVTVKEGNYFYNPEFYVIRHFSMFVKKGAVMLKTAGSFSSNTTVFQNMDGSRVAVILNPFDEKKVIHIEDQNYVLKPRSFNTIVL